MNAHTRRIFGGALLAVAATLGACAGGSDDAAQDTTAAQGTAAGDTLAARADTGHGAHAAHAAGGSFLDPDVASREDLQKVPGMTPAAADALVAGRPYPDMLAVDRVLARQLPDTAARKAIYAHVWKPIDLNTAKGPEIQLIPGVGPRMRHEFEEYRPYKNIEQFRREIGKYVDKDEVARLERYVTIR